MNLRFKQQNYEQKSMKRKRKLCLLCGIELLSFENIYLKSVYKVRDDLPNVPLKGIKELKTILFYYN